MRNGDDVWLRLLEDGKDIGPSPQFAGLDDAALEQEVRTQAVVLAAATCRWLEHLAEFVIRGLWAEGGVRTPADWLAWALGIGPSTAREHVRVALRLRECPAVLERFREGRLSYSKVRAITRICVPAIEGLLLKFADAATARDLDRIVTGFRRMAQNEPDPDRSRRAVGVDWRWDDDGLLEVRLKLEPGDGLAFIDAMSRLVEVEQTARDREDDTTDGAEGLIDLAAAQSDDPGDAGSPRRDSLRQIRADVLLDTVIAAAAHDAPRDGSGADRHLLVLHAAVEQLAGAASAGAHADEGVDPPAEAGDEPEGSSRSAPAEAANQRLTKALKSVQRPVPVTSRVGRGMLPAHVLRRLACDGRIAVGVTGKDGNLLTEPAPKSTVPAPMRRAMLTRDRHTCQFPGCGSTRHLHAHHVIHWSDGGPTELGNLMTLCSFHHRFVHAHHWQLRPVPGRPGRWTFHKPGSTAAHPAVPEQEHLDPRFKWLRTLASGIRALPDDLAPKHWMAGWDLNMCMQVIEDHLNGLSHTPIPEAA